MLGVRMLTNADQLKAMLPDRFELRGPPVVTSRLQLHDRDRMAGGARLQPVAT
jgi:hypothetical protein